MNSTTPIRLDLSDMIVTAEWDGEGPQPWSDRQAYKYTIRVSAKGGEWSSTAWGSQADFERADYTHAEEMAWMMLHDLLSALDDPDEFFELSYGEPDRHTLDRVRGILEVIDYATKIGPTLEANRSEIEEAYNRS